MILNKKVVNYKAVQLFDIYNFCFGHFLRLFKSSI